MTDARVEAFLVDILALEGENPDAIREGIHVALADCADIFKVQEVNRRMKNKARSRSPRAMPRAAGRRNPTTKRNDDGRTLSQVYAANSSSSAQVH